MATYDIGDTVRFSVAFTNAAGAAADPTTISATVKDPSGNTADYTYALATVSKSATGSYYVDISIDEAGTWWCRWVSTGDPAQAAEQRAYTQRSAVV